MMSVGCRGAPSKVVSSSPRVAKPFLVVKERRRVPNVVAQAPSSSRLWLIRQRQGTRRDELDSLSVQADLRVVSRESIGSGAQALVYAFGSVWVAGASDSGAAPIRLSGTLRRINPVNGSLQFRLRMPPVSAITATSLGVWVATGSKLRRIDPRGRTTAILKLPPRVIVRLATTPAGPAVAITTSTGHSAVWLVSDKTLHIRRSKQIADRIYAIAYGGSRVWLTLSSRVIQLRLPDVSTAASSLDSYAPGMIAPISSSSAFIANNARDIVLLRATDSRLRTSATKPIGGRIDTLLSAAGTLFAYDTIAYRMTLLGKP